MRTGRTIELWQDELGPFPPYRLDGDAIFFSYMLSADFGAHIVLGWGQPAHAICPYVEFRHLTNDARIRSGDREKGFYSLAGALRYFGDDGIDRAQKDDVRDRIVAGPPFNTEERQTILDYCRSDVMALARWSSTSSQPSDRCHMPSCAGSSCGRLRSRSTVVCRLICPCSTGLARGGTIFDSIL
jgi:hypothetical protein